MIDLEEIYPTIFFGGSAVFAVLAVAYLGFDYLNHLSSMTVSVVIFSVFALSFLIATTRESLMKTVFYLTAAGSYLLFLIYSGAKFIEGTGALIVLLLLSSGLFGAIGYILNSRPDKLPDVKQIKIISAALISIIALFVIYNILFVQIDYSFQLNDTAVIQEEEQTVGQLYIDKQGYLPMEQDYDHIDFCLSEGRYLPAEHVTLPDEDFGFRPEKRSQQLILDITEELFADKDRPNDLPDLNEGEEVEIVRVMDCEGVQEGQLGVSIGEKWNSVD